MGFAENLNLKTENYFYPTRQGRATNIAQAGTPGLLDWGERIARCIAWFAPASSSNPKNQMTKEPNNKVFSYLTGKSG